MCPGKQWDKQSRKQQVSKHAIHPESTTIGAEITAVAKKSASLYVTVQGGNAAEED